MMKNPHLKEDFGHNKISFNDFVRDKRLGPKAAQRFKQFLEDECGCTDDIIIMEKLFENILNESRKGPELQFIVSSYISKDGLEKWRVEEEDKFDEAIGIGHNVRFKLSELKDLIYSLPDKIIEYRNATTEYDGAIKHECYLKEIRRAFHEALIVKYNTTFIYRSVKSEGYVELYILLDYDSFEKYLNE